MEFYEPAELERVVHRSASLLDVEIDPQGAAEIAGRSRGTPRIANRLLRRVRDYAQVKADGLITQDIAARPSPSTRSIPGASTGWTGPSSRPCSSCSGGGPVGLSTLSVAVGEERETVEEVAEPFLVREGLLARNPARGGWPPRRHGRISASRRPAHRPPQTDKGTCSGRDARRLAQAGTPVRC
ncbi:hypothetical protein GCM10023238_27850 [Streptomyces heliomycini]